MSNNLVTTRQNKTADRQGFERAKGDVFEVPGREAWLLRCVFLGLYLKVDISATK